jgi:hypothetical protein
MVTGKDWEDQRFDRPGFHPKDPLSFPGLGEIGRFWRDLEALGQVVTMQLRHDKVLEARFFGVTTCGSFGSSPMSFPWAFLLL